MVTEEMQETILLPEIQIIPEEMQETTLQPEIQMVLEEMQETILQPEIQMVTQEMEETILRPEMQFDMDEDLFNGPDEVEQNMFDLIMRQIRSNGSCCFVRQFHKWLYTHQQRENDEIHVENSLY